MIKSNKERLVEGRQLEKSGDFEAAAKVYRKIVDNDPLLQEAVSRLLVVYRKLKNYQEELAVINQVLVAYIAEDKARQEKWVREHSKAAEAGTAVFQKLGGSSVSGFGANPAVVTLMKRKEVVERKIPGKKGVKKARKSTIRPAAEKKGAAARVEAAAQLSRQAEQKRREIGIRRKQEERDRRDAAAAERKLAAERQKEEAAARKAEMEARKAEAAAKKAREAEAKKAREVAARKAAEEGKRPSLFVVILQYQGSLEEIDAAMAEHVAFLDKQYKKGDFLVSGRQEPRVGGIILARGKGREAVERLMRADPLVRKGLATVEVVEFKASRMDKGLARYFNRKK